jgi:hypothetical protein
MAGLTGAEGYRTYPACCSCSGTTAFRYGRATIYRFLRITTCGRSPLHGLRTCHAIVTSLVTQLRYSDLFAIRGKGCARIPAPLDAQTGPVDDAPLTRVGRANLCYCGGLGTVTCGPLLKGTPAPPPPAPRQPDQVNQMLAPAPAPVVADAITGVWQSSSEGYTFTVTRNSDGTHTLTGSVTTPDGVQDMGTGPLYVTRGPSPIVFTR